MSDKYLYVISESAEGPIKIGISVSPPLRLLSLQTGNPRPLSIMAAWNLGREAVEAEQFLKEELSCFAMVGEWLSVSEQFMREYMPNFFEGNGFEVVEAS